MQEKHCIQKQSPRRVLSKKVLLEISQSSQENTCARVSFLIKLQASDLQLYLKRDSGTDVFPWILWNFGKSHTQCCPNTSETTLHKKITCAILALSAEQWFWRKITYTTICLFWSAWAKIAQNNNLYIAETATRGGL